MNTEKRSKRKTLFDERKKRLETGQDCVAWKGTRSTNSQISTSKSKSKETLKSFEKKIQPQLSKPPL